MSSRQAVSMTSERQAQAAAIQAAELAPAYELIREVSERYVQRRIAAAFREAGLDPPASAQAYDPKPEDTHPEGA